MKKTLLGLAVPLFLFGLFRIASAATLNLSPATGNWVAGVNYDVDINLDTTGQAIDGVDIYKLHFNPGALQVQDSNSGVAGVQITAGSLLSQTLTNSADNTAGTVTFSQVTSGGTTYTGSGKLATITFKAIASGTTAVTFDFTLGSTADTNVAGSGADKLTAVNSGSYTITGGNPAPPPPPPPTPNPTPNPTPPPPTPNPSPTPPPPAPTPDSYPVGLIFKYAGNATVYVLGPNNVANPITDFTVYQNNVAPTRMITTIPSSVVFTIGPVLGLRSGALVKAKNDTTVYLIVNSSKRPFASEAEFTGNGYSFSSVYTINDINLVASYPTITTPFQRPFGTWFKYANNPTIYFLNSARLKRPFTTWTMYKLWVDDPKHVVVIKDSETYADGPLVTFPDGILIKGSANTIYLTQSGTLRPFTNSPLFLSLGYKFTDVIKVEDGDLSLEPLGSPL